MVYGEFVTPKSERMKSILEEKRWDQITKIEIDRRGLIIIDEDYKNEEEDPELYITAIHEMIHSNRALLLFDAVRNDKNSNAYTFNNGKYEQNTSECDASYVDASQEILKGNIDTSKGVVSKYDGNTDEDMETIEFHDEEKETQIEKQVKVDEALVELIAALSEILYTNKEIGNPVSIWRAIEKAQELYEGQDVEVMCRIILKHQDFELFNWMLDPITYSEGDVHYDFFSKYTKDDQDLVEEFYNSPSPCSEWSMPEYLADKIHSKAVEKIAKSPESMQHLSGAEKLIQNLRNISNIDKQI